MPTTDLTGRTCFVTGATSGIGEESALAFARMGARVGILARSLERAEATRARIARETGRSIEIVEGDLSSLASTRGAAAEVLRRFDAIHVWLNNAGLIVLDRETTPDGFERTFATNHLGPYLLTRLVLPRIVESAPARIVNVASEAHRFAKAGLDFDDLQNEREYKTFRVYGESKLANLLFTRELARRLEDTGVTVNSVHPGAVATRLGAQNGLFARLVITVLKPFFRSPAKGAATSIHVATTPALADITGRYFIDRRETAPAPHALDDAAARRLWDTSAELVGLSG
jgi:NAD(P)-dependent dehydrogenase (short-subunit alcohol dehydrogenase family)